MATNYITNDEFLQQQEYLGSGYDGLVQLNNVVQSGLNAVVDSQNTNFVIDTLYFYNQNLINVNSAGTANLLRLATTALQTHITQRTGQTFNDYLYLSSLKVTPSFANLSALLGVPISPVNVQGQ